MSDQKPPKTLHRRRRAPPQLHNDNDVSTITTRLSLTSLSPPQSAMVTPTRLLVVSLGNPGRPYASTLHSAGHTVLQSLLPLLPSNTAFAKSRAFANGLLSTGSVFTLWESPTYMNVSGPAVLSAWRAFTKEHHDPEGRESKLVVIHDELESALGKVSVKSGSGSARGHNGLKSIKGSFPGNLEYKRIGVGIGRPESREPADVAGYVLRKMTGQEKAKIERAAVGVLAELERIAGV